jgi:hypothetical protein
MTLTFSQSRRHWHMILLSIIARHRARRQRRRFKFEKSSRKRCDRFEKKTFSTLTNTAKLWMIGWLHLIHQRIHAAKLCMGSDRIWASRREANTPPPFPLLGRKPLGNFQISQFPNFPLFHSRSCHYIGYCISSTCFSYGYVSLQGTYAAMVF